MRADRSVEAAAKASETSFENAAYWERVIAALDVDGQALAVVYDDGPMTEAPRVWFRLQYFGAKALILNGGWPAVPDLENLLGTAGGPVPRRRSDRGRDRARSGSPTGRS